MSRTWHGAQQLEALLVSVDELHEDPQNARAHPLRNMEVIKGSLTDFGQVRAILTSSDGTVIAGNGTLRAVRELGWTHIAAVRFEGTPHEARQYAIIDNKSAELAEWDQEGFAATLEALREEDPEFSVASLGFSDEEVRKILGTGDYEKRENEEGEDDVPLPPKAAVTKLGDIWLLGDHRLLCGDCRDEKTTAVFLDPGSVNVAFTSPPYASQRKYDETSAFLPIAPDAYAEWFEAVQACVKTALAPDGSWFVNIKEHCDEGQRSLYVMDLVIAHVRRWGWRYIDELVWKHGGMPGTWPNRFKNQWEPVFHFARRKGIKFNPDTVSHESQDSFEYAGQVEGNASTTNPISFSGSSVNVMAGTALPGNVLSLGKSRESDIAHEAIFPVGLPLFFILAYSDVGDSVLDPFCGSGTTLLACEKASRKGLGVEISPAYCDIATLRWQNLTGKPAIRESDGKTFDELRGEGQ